MSSVAIDVEGIAKRYTLGGGPYATLQETLGGLVRPRSRKERRSLWALRDLSFQVDEGEVLGVIGLNGAGKSTLLKILTRITEPTAGRSRTRGRVGALLEVGTGFHPELSGRENIFLNGAILGMRRAEIRTRFDEIVQFAGVEQFLDTPLKRYSSGMCVRLAFAVAAYLDPDVLIVDEVLAVGDVQFRERCLGRISEFAREGRTVVYVSHDLGSVSQLCERTIWLEQGTLRDDGPTETVIDAYVQGAVPRTSQVTFSSDPSAPVQLLSAALAAPDGSMLEAPRRDQPFALELRFTVRNRIPGVGVSFMLDTAQGLRVLDEDWGADTNDALEPNRLPQEYVARMIVPPVLSPGDYVFVALIHTPFENVIEQEVLSFRLWPGPRDTAEAIGRGRLVQPGVQWRIEETDPAGKATA